MVICAAIKVKNKEETVIPCLRHCNGFWILRDLCPEQKLHIGVEEGFINHRGEFLDREEAFQHALACGQLSAELRHLKAERDENALFSEDLY